MKPLGLSILTFFFLSGAHGTEVRFPAASVSYTHANSQNYKGKQTEITADAAFGDRLRMGIVGSHLRRDYNGGVHIVDSGYGLSSAYKLTSHTYLEAMAMKTPNAEIVPKWSAVVTPRWVVGLVDIGVGLDYREYRQVTAGMVHPNLVYDFNRHLTMKAGFFATRSESTLFSSHGEVVYRPRDKHAIKFGGAGGDTLEDAGLQAHFNNAFLSYGMDCGRFHFSIEGGRYWSDTREERSMTFRLDFR